MDSFWLADAVKAAGGINRNVAPYATQQTTNRMYLQDYLIAGETTHSADSAITDSAAAGTALAGGYKTNLYQIGIDEHLRPHANVLEAAQLLGKKTGLVAIYEFPHATPAAFSAHAPSRYDYRSMAEQIVNQGIDVVLTPNISKSDWSGAYSAIVNRGYTIVDSKNKVNAIQKGDKVWGNFSVGNSFDYALSSSNPNLSEMTAAAIRALECDEGFFMMVEGSAIDEGGHNNNAFQMVGDFIAFDEACKVAIEYAKTRNDTAVFIAPDHDTGGMNVLNEATAVTNIQNGQVPATSAVSWSSTYHTARHGGVFLYLPEGVAYPEGTSSTPGLTSNYTNYVVDNTLFAPYLANLMGTDLDTATTELFLNVSSLGTYTPTTDSDTGTNNHTGYFTFNDADCTIQRNTSVAVIDGKEVDLDGQVAVYLDGSFYVPKKLLDILDLEISVEWTGNVKNEFGFNDYTGGFSGADATEDSSVANGGSISSRGFCAVSGDYAYYNFDAPYTGVYGMQLKISELPTVPTTIRVTAGEYYADFDITTTGWTNIAEMLQDQAIYLKEGFNSIKVENIGPGTVTFEKSDFARLDAYDSMDYMPFVKSVNDPDYVENPLITSESITKMGTAPTFWGNVYTQSGVTQNGNGFDLEADGWVTFQVPVSTAGIYYPQITASGGDTTLKIEVGNEYYTKISVGKDNQNYYQTANGDYGFVYLFDGKVPVKVKNIGTESCTITDVQFIASMNAVNAGTTPSMKDIISLAKWTGNAKNQAGYYNGDFGGSEIAATIAEGESTAITINDVPYTGVYALQLRVDAFSGTGYVRATTDAGYYADYSVISPTVWTYNMVPAQDQPIYLTKGTNTLYLENTGYGDLKVGAYNLVRLDAGDSMEFEYTLKQGTRIPGDGSTAPSPTTPPAEDAEPTVSYSVAYEKLLANIVESSGCHIDSKFAYLSVYERENAYLTVKIGVPETGDYYLQGMLDTSNGAVLYGTVTAAFDSGATATWATGALPGSTNLAQSSPRVTLTKGDHYVTLKTNDPYSNVYFRGLHLQKAAEIPDMPDYVTNTDINTPGTASTIGGCLTGGIGAEADPSNFVAVPNGGTATFTVPCSDAGIYKLQLKFSKGGAVRVEVNETYYQELYPSSWTFVNTDPSGKPAYIYFNEGDNYVTFYNKTGSDGVLTNLEFKQTMDLWTEGTLFTMDDLKEYDPTPTATPTPTETPAPTPTPTLPDGLTWVGNSSQQDGFASYLGTFNGPDLLYAGQSATFTVNSAYSGVLGAQVRIDGLGGASTLRMAAGNYYCDIPFTGTETAWCDDELLDRPLYLQQGANTLTVTNLGPNYIDLAKIDFAYLNADGFDSLVYLPLVGQFDTSEPDPTPVPTPTPVVYPDGVTTESIDRPGLGYSLWDNVTNQGASGIGGNAERITIDPGAEAHFSITVPQTGFYYMQTKTRNGATTLRIEADPYTAETVYYAELPVQETLQFYNKNAKGEYEFIYLTEGTHELVLRNTGSVNCRVINLELKASMYAYEEGVTPNMNMCKSFIYTNDFTGFALSGNTANVSYRKIPGAEDVYTLYIAEYNGNKLIQINLVTIDPEKQTDETIQNYSVGLNGVTGTLKAMLLDSNLVPCFPVAE